MVRKGGFVQHKTALGLHRAAQKHRVAQEVAAQQGQFDFFKEAFHVDVTRLVDHQAQGATFTVLTHIHHAAGEHGILQPGHGNQEMIG